MKKSLLIIGCCCLAITGLYLAQKEPIPQKADIHYITDVAKYQAVFDRTSKLNPDLRIFSEKVRQQAIELSKHPKATEIDFKINPEFKASLDKLLSSEQLTLVQLLILEDHFHRLAHLADQELTKQPRIKNIHAKP